LSALRIDTGDDGDSWELHITLPNGSELVCRAMWFFTKTEAEEEMRG
jgi:hypothetical protein